MVQLESHRLPAMKIHRLTPTHAAEYRAVMLQVQADEPDAFTTTLAEREALPLAWWASRVSDDPGSAELVLGAFAGDRLTGVVGLRFGFRQRTMHKALLVGMAVLPSVRRQGIGRALVDAALDHARSVPSVGVVQLGVVQSNVGALRLYESCGFLAFGTEPLGIRIGERFEAIVHMWRALDAGMA